MRRLPALPLRFTLVAALLVLSGLGLLASGIAVTSSLQGSLLSRIDRDLHDAAHGWARPLGTRPDPPPPAVGPDRPPSLFYVQVLNPDGTARVTINDRSAAPALPGAPTPEPVTVGSVGGSGPRWRVLTTSNPDGGTTTVAMSLEEIGETVGRLVVLQLGIGTAVLVVLGVAGYFVVRRSLRPLREVERTAVAIAGGDLHERVPERDPRTEVGQLSVALNSMLAQIQSAFAATAASEESARRSEEKMRRFVADAGHELRTPLTTIRGFSELYRQGASRDTDLLMTRIENESRRMGVLVEDLLMLARLDAQRPLEQKPVDLLALAADAVHGARAVAPDRTIGLEVIDGPGTPEVLGDVVRLRQVVDNLVANALTHTPADASVTVRVGTVGEDAVLEVADTGPGLAEEDRERVFERFYRTDTSRTRASGGSGLGLSIVAALVAAHGGTVDVDSEVGRGATFRVLLPRRQVD
ncbi:HAMP domain-containing histidine kinase [Rhodococcus sp. HM1]|uniref:sensor histidine kinase n=1 Tax=unclassified Rhodococcus (in: high G+C Gram-positive bacteria) TaxID=192944 RepID=UPI0018CDCB68|nr:MULTISPECIES: HAMP domain-containing sensor histidine kinase [unclassified Rhodococcus (in: high G+C Gram-positive bacteria)]MBH0119334.1 HAMP domain-containing histidine kinase [Rhodococcus sp. CX]MCK8673317.1 HAMP domain-containing histidine kinase [Rhodococcus sp. HM1]